MHKIVAKLFLLGKFENFESHLRIHCEHQIANRI